MKRSTRTLLAATLVAQAAALPAVAGNRNGMQFAASPASPGLSLTAKPGCVKKVAGTKWKGTKYYQNGASSNFTIVFNAGGMGTESSTVVSPVNWQQLGTTVGWKKNIEDGNVRHKVQLKCNKMAGTFRVYDIAGPLISTGNVKLTLMP